MFSIAEVFSSIIVFFFLSLIIEKNRDIDSGVCMSWVLGDLGCVFVANIMTINDFMGFGMLNGG